MANKLRGEVEIKVGSEGAQKTLVLRLGMNELIELQDELGYKDRDEEFLEDLKSGHALRSLKRTRTALRRALLHRQPDTTDEMAGDVITEIGVPRTNTLLSEALRWSMPDRELSSPGKGEGRSAGKPS
jgi:hypothetical protein